MTNVALNVSGTGYTADLYSENRFALDNAIPGDADTVSATATDTDGRTASASLNYTWPTTNGFAYDLNGNLRTNGTTIYAYDDENQLTQVVVTNSTRSEFSYDGKMRRRVRKESVWANGDWRQVLEVRYVYDGNFVIQERHFEFQLSTTPQRSVSYTRGLDLSGSFQGAGGIGGLLVCCCVNN